MEGSFSTSNKPSIATNTKSENSIYAKGQELFNYCDTDNKGYLNRKDLGQIQNELRLTESELNEVFKMLDEDKDDRLTLEEFADGFGIFLAIANNRSRRKHPKKFCYPNGRALSPIREHSSDPYDDFLENIGCKHLFRNDELVHSMWKHVSEENPVMMLDLQQFLAKAAAELTNSKTECLSLESVFKANNTTSEEHLRQLYEDMEKKIESEKTELLAKERAKNQRIRQELEEELRTKSQLLAQIGNQHEAKRDELERKLKVAEKLRIDAEKEYKALSTENLLVRKKHQRSLEGVSSRIHVEEDLIAMEIEKLKEENKVLMDDSDSRSHESLHECLRQDSAISNQLIDSPDESVETEETDGRISPLFSYFHADNSRNEEEDIFEESFERSFYGQESDEIVKLPSCIHKGKYREVYEFPASNSMISWKVTCKFSVNTEKQEMKPLWKVKMKCFPTSVTSTSDQVQLVYSSNKIPMSVPAVSNHDSTDSFLFTDPIRTFKIIFLGNSGVGKTSYIRRFCNNTFRPSFESTIGIDFQEKGIIIEDNCVILQLWDTAGQERYQSICKQYFRKVDAVLVMYDVTSEQSFISIRTWMENIKDNTDEDVVKLLIGNKIDAKRCIQTSHGDQLAEEYGALFFETSAKYGINVNEAMEELAKSLDQRYQNKRSHLKLKEHCHLKKRCC